MRRKRNAQWRMRDGTLILIRKMTDSHLTNAIAMCERVAEARAQRQVNELYLFAGGIQGEQAGYALDAMIDELEEYGGEALLEDNTPYQLLLAEQAHRIRQEAQ